jgi:site-specific DNA recombinase
LKRRAKKAAGTNAVIYCRVSTEDQVDNLSLPTQRERSIAFCQKSGWPVAQIFTDEGKSAKTTQREAFQDMLNFCKDAKHQVGYVVVHDLSRFSRNMGDQLITIAQLSSVGVVLRSVLENFDETPSGKLMRNVTGSFNQFENERKAERTILGMKQAAGMGRFPFKAPLGYINVSAHTGRNLIADPNSAPLIRKAFELAVTGLHTKTEILKTVTNLGLRTTKGKTLSSQTFQKILLNPIYAGWVVIPSWGLKNRGSFDALVSDQLFEDVQDVLAGRTKKVSAHARNHPDFPLRVFVRCQKCGTPLTGSWSTGRTIKYAYYRCRLSGCAGVNVGREVLERKFVELLEWLTPDGSLLPLFKQTVRDVWKRRQGDSEAIFKLSQKKLVTATQKKDQLVDALLDKRIDQHTYDQQVIRLSKENEETERELRAAEAEFIDLEAVLAFAEKIISRPARLWVESALDQKQRLQTVYFPGGLSFDGVEFGTGTTSLLFNILKGFAANDDDLASPTGFEPVLPP